MGAIGRENKMRKRNMLIIIMLLCVGLAGCKTTQTGNGQEQNVEMAYEKLFEMFLLDESTYQISYKEIQAADETIEQQEKKGEVIREEGIQADLDYTYRMIEESEEEGNTIDICIQEGRFCYATSEGALVAEAIENIDLSDKTPELGFCTSEEAVTEAKMILEDYAGLDLPEEIEVYGVSQDNCELLGEEVNQEYYVIWFGTEHNIEMIYGPEGTEFVSVFYGVSEND